MLTAQQWIAVAGAASGALGSILTAFSLSDVIRELHLARQFIEITLRALAENQDVPIFTGLDRRQERAEKRGRLILWAGVLLLVAGFILQAVAVCWTPAGP